MRASTIVDGRHFTLTEQEGEVSYTVRGTVEATGTVVTEFRAGEELYKISAEIPPQQEQRRLQMVARAEKLAQPERFFVEEVEGGVALILEGAIDKDD